MYEPDVGDMISENHIQQVTVLGAVKNAGVFELSGPKTLRDILAMAGGVTNEAGTFVHVARQGPQGTQNYSINLLELARGGPEVVNLPISGGDVITVPPAGTFFVDGRVKRPGSYPLVRDYTLSQALAVAGGLDRDAKASAITIFRRDDTGAVKALEFDLKRIQALDQEDVRVAENDVIVVPTSMAKIVFSTLLDSVGFGVRSASFGWGFGGRGGNRRY
jgi:polysaccharide export outer membrane protein